MKCAAYRSNGIIYTSACMKIVAWDFKFFINNFKRTRYKVSFTKRLLVNKHLLSRKTFLNTCKLKILNSLFYDQPKALS